MNKKLLLEVCDLSVQFPKQHEPAFENVRFSVYENTVFGIFGETGCGKSTIAKYLTGFLPCEHIIKGEMWFYDEAKIPLHLKTEKYFQQYIRGQKVVYVPQDPYQTLNPHESLWDQLQRVITLSQNFRKPQELLEQVQLPLEKAKACPETLSAGQRQRGTIALALARSPKVLIFDEPTASLDRNTRNDLLHFFAELTKQKLCTIIVISHEIFDYYELIDKQNRFYFNKHDSTHQNFSKLNSNNDEIILQTMNLSKSYENNEVLKNIDLKVKNGEWIYLHGKNGCGKSTFMHVLSGIQALTKGKIFWNNHDISNKIMTYQKYIHLVFQDSFHSMNPRQTISKILQEVIYCNSLFTQNLQEFAHLWNEILEIPKKIYQSLPSQISYGQQKRIALLRTLLKYKLYQLQSPQQKHLFLLDEVFAGLHLTLRYKIMQNLQNLYQNQQNFAIIWIAHGQDQLQDYCNTNYTLMDGVLRKYGK